MWIIFRIIFFFSFVNIAGDLKGPAFSDLTELWRSTIFALLREFEKKQRIKLESVGPRF
jgi:hypothetical protein